jgi:hypothetical protein
MAGAWTEDEIAAFVDGELDEAARARIAAALDSDPEAAALAVRLRETDALLRDAFAAPLGEEVPKAIAATLAAPTAAVLPFRVLPRRAQVWVPAALAASLALVAGLAGGMMLDLGEASRPAAAILALGPAEDQLAQALDRVPSGEAEGRMRPLASFVVDSGVCREFEMLDAAAAPTGFGMACRDGEGWSVIFAVATRDDGAEADGSGFVPASGAVVDAAGPLLDTLGAGPALDPAAEREAIARGWRP